MNQKSKKNMGFDEFKDGINSKAWNSVGDENKLNHRFKSLEAEITILTYKLFKVQSLILVQWVGKGIGFF